MRESVVQRRQTVVIEEESRDSSATPTELAIAINNCGGNSSLGGECPLLANNDHECETHTTDISTATTTTTTTTTTATTNNADKTNGKDIVRRDSSRIDSNINVILIYNTRL